jgi:hypothetical protein
MNFHGKEGRGKGRRGGTRRGESVDDGRKN